MIELYFIFYVLYLIHSFSSLFIHVAFMFHRQAPSPPPARVCYLYSLIKHCNALYSQLIFTRLQLPFIPQYIFSCICMCPDAYANPFWPLIWSALGWKYGYNIMCIISRRVASRNRYLIFPFIISIIIRNNTSIYTYMLYKYILTYKMLCYFTFINL